MARRSRPSQRSAVLGAIKDALTNQGPLQKLGFVCFSSHVRVSS
jgi:hypothetical protein